MLSLEQGYCGVPQISRQILRPSAVSNLTFKELLTCRESTKDEPGKAFLTFKLSEAASVRVSSSALSPRIGVASSS